MSAAGTPEHESGQAVAEEGVVMLDGPDGVAVSMTPSSAEATARSLQEAANAARGQKPNG